MAKLFNEYYLDIVKNARKKPLVKIDTIGNSSKEIENIITMRKPGIALIKHNLVLSKKVKPKESYWN